LEKVIFIDRDGVVNKDLWKYVERWDEFEFLPGVLDAFKILKEAGYKTIIISNQAGIGDGIFTESALEDINKNFVRVVTEYGGRIDDMFYCLHGKKAGCACRKPEVGLFEAAAEKWDFDRGATYFIGDKLTDIEAGKRFGLKTVLVKTGYGERDSANITDVNRPDMICSDLNEAVRRIVAGSDIDTITGDRIDV
jgi:D-glycero-D-manno-heptose 1,7-bisphosphate phosphatase